MKLVHKPTDHHYIRTFENGNVVVWDEVPMEQIRKQHPDVLKEPVHVYNSNTFNPATGFFLIFVGAIFHEIFIDMISLVLVAFTKK